MKINPNALIKLIIAIIGLVTAILGLMSLPAVKSNRLCTHKELTKI